MTTEELRILNQAMGDLGDTFSRNRVLRQRQNEFDQTRGDRNRSDDLDREMRKEEF
jgi:hypothetical protein